MPLTLESQLSRSIARWRERRSDAVVTISPAIHNRRGFSMDAPAISGYEAIRAQFNNNRLLFGDPAEPGIVALEIAPPKEVEIFRRVEGKIVRERRPLRLFAIVSDRELLRGFKPPHEISELSGELRFRYLATFGSLAALEAARRHLRNVTGKPPGAPDAPYFVLTDHGRAVSDADRDDVFRGTRVRQLQSACRSTSRPASVPGFEFPSGAREGDRVGAIAITDSTGFERVLLASEMDEKAMLERARRDHPRARPRRYRRTQPVPLRSRLPSGARAAPWRGAEAGARRQSQ